MEVGGAAAHPSPGEVFASENAELEEYTGGPLGGRSPDQLFPVPRVLPAFYGQAPP